MVVPTCPFGECEASVRIRRADEMPTQKSQDGKYKTVFDVKYCDNGHQIKYIDRQILIET